MREEQSTPPDVAAPATPLEVARAHRRRLLHAVSARTGLLPESITDEREGVRALRVRGVTAETAHAVVAALADLGARGYAAPGVVPDPASVPDVEAFPGHVACSALSRSEVVVPVVVEGEVVAVLDVDAVEPDAFREDHVEGLERVVELVAARWNGWA